MKTELTSVVIPVFNGAAHVGEAIDSALAQTAHVEVIVVDNGSTDATAAVCLAYGDRIRYERLETANVAAARNRGIDLAAGDFIQLLDHDDILHPEKVRRCLAAFHPETGFVYSDGYDVAVDGTKRLCSEAYRNTKFGASGWLDAWLGVENFIQIHLPLYRRSAIGAIRFVDLQGLDEWEVVQEDWHFLYYVSASDGGRARYLPEPLATRRRRPGSRGTQRRRVGQLPPCQPPLRLNLGCGTLGKPSWKPQPGMVNLDKSLGWTYEDGKLSDPTPGQCLAFLADGTVHGITVSHSLMFVEMALWPGVFAEFQRVLAPGGVIRITEDDTENPQSKVYGVGWKGSESAVTLTGPAMVRRHLIDAGLAPVDVEVGALDAHGRIVGATTQYRDGSLQQAWHGQAPHVFAIEGVRAAEVLFSPHHDDETLFAAFTLIKHKPMVVVCYPSKGDYGDTATREAETKRACGHLGAGPVVTWEGGDIEAQMRALDARIKPTRIWAPHSQASHPEHVTVATAAAAVFGSRLETFHTYEQGGVKVRGREVVPEPAWIGQKLLALAEYRSQYTHPRALTFFLDDLREWAGEPGIVAAYRRVHDGSEPGAWSLEPGGQVVEYPLVLDGPGYRAPSYPVENLVTDDGQPFGGIARKQLAVVTWLWGDGPFGWTYVEKLHAMLMRQLRTSFELFVVTDHWERDPLSCGHGITVVPMPLLPPGADFRCRRRIWQFSKERLDLFGPRMLCIDLDVVLTDDITPLVERTEPIVAWKADYTEPHRHSPAFLLCDTGALDGFYEAAWHDMPAFLKKMKQKDGSDLPMLNHWLAKSKTPIASFTAADGVVPYFGDGYKQAETHLSAKHPALPPGTRVVLLGGADTAVLEQGQYDWVREFWRQ